MNKSEPTIEDYKDMMQQLEMSDIKGYEWTFFVWCDENGHSEFMDNFFNEMKKQAKNYGK